MPAFELTLKQHLVTNRSLLAPSSNKYQLSLIGPRDGIVQ